MDMVISKRPPQPQQRLKILLILQPQLRLLQLRPMEYCNKVTRKGKLMGPHTMNIRCLVMAIEPKQQEEIMQEMEKL